MCGIFCEVLCNNTGSVTSAPLFCDKYIKALKRRGPDCICEATVNLPGDVSCHLVGTVLWMQGEEPISQPIKDDQGNFLLWNGEVFNTPLPWPPSSGSSDTEMLSKVLSSSACPLKDLALIRGPFAFVYLQVKPRRLWFGRDRIGRHSLLSYADENKRLVLSSVGNKNVAEWTEVPTDGIYCVNFENGYNIVLHPWSDFDSTNATEINGISVRISEDRVPSPICQPTQLLVVEPPERVASIFNQFLGSNLPPEHILKQLLTDTNIRVRVDRLIELLTESVRIRVETQPKLCRLCIAQKYPTRDGSLKTDTSNRCCHPKLGVLFSGGLDSAVLALLSDKFVPPDTPIDLINVAFERPRNPNAKVHRNDKKSVPAGYDVPDRKTGRQTLAELRLIRPERQWQFVEVNVTQAELMEKRNNVISDLIHPLNTILDDSLGCALWFAARGTGSVETGAQGEPYVSTARVLLLGMGADEQMGGYMRHRTSLSHSGWPTLSDQLRSDTANIATRNLGRDDRIVSDAGRQGRFPYLDEDVVNFLNGIATWEKCFPVGHLPPGTGDKYILRLAAVVLGLNQVAVLPKRAMQFGSRIANGREKGSDTSERLQQTPVQETR